MTSLEPDEAVEQRTPALQPVPARHLEYDRTEQQLDLVRQERRPQAAVALQAQRGVLEGRLDRRAERRNQLCIDQYPDELVNGQLPVLVAERVERGLHDRHRASELRRHIFRRGEEGVVGVGEVWCKEVPGGARLRKLLVETDVTTPDGGDAA